MIKDYWKIILEKRVLSLNSLRKYFGKHWQKIKKQSLKRLIKKYLRSHIDGYKKSSNETHSDNSNYRKAISMLSEYRNGDIEFNQIFDIDIFARHYALSRVFSAEHGERWHNRRFYYNSITDKLEPIGFDGDALFNVDTINDLFQSKMHFSWMEKESNNFESVSTIAKYLELFLILISYQLMKRKLIIMKEFFWEFFKSSSRLNRDILKRNKLHIKEYLNPNPKMLASAILYMRKMIL